MIWQCGYVDCAWICCSRDINDAAYSYRVWFFRNACSGCRMFNRICRMDHASQKSRRIDRGYFLKEHLLLCFHIRYAIKRNGHGRVVQQIVCGGKVPRVFALGIIGDVNGCQHASGGADAFGVLRMGRCACGQGRR